MYYAIAPFFKNMLQFSTGKLSTRLSLTITTNPWGQTNVLCTSPMSVDAEAAITASSQRSASLLTGHGRLTSISTFQTGAQHLYLKTAQEPQYCLSHRGRDSKLCVFPIELLCPQVNTYRKACCSPSPPPPPLLQTEWIESSTSIQSVFVLGMHGHFSSTKQRRVAFRVHFGYLWLMELHRAPYWDRCILDTHSR